jgi:flagellar hook-associated protein 3 FlgL
MTISSSNPLVTTPNMLSSDLISSLNLEQTNMSSLELQISSGNAINVASDDPAGATNMLQLQASVTRSNQYLANAQDATGWLSTGNQTVNSVLNVLSQVQSLVEGVSGAALSGGGAQLSSIATEISGDLSQVSDLANTQYEGGQPIFAGTGNATEAYDASGNYLGAGSAPTRTVAPNTQIAVAVTGPQVFGTGTTGLLSTTPGSLGVLAQIVQDLQTGTPTSLAAVTGTDLTNLKNSIAQVQSAAATLGANQQAVEGFSTQATNTTASLQQQLGSVQDVNMAQAITNLQLQQTSYQAALYATSQLSSESLVQYL